MLDELIKDSHINITCDGEEVVIDNIKDLLTDITTNHYLAPCMAYAEDKFLQSQRKKGVWIELSFNEVKSYKDFEFEKLLINLFPKHDFLVMHRFVDDMYQGKSITINLAYKTTELYKYILECKKAKNNEK